MVVAATGFFDGVHTGHRAVLEAVRQEAHARGAKSMVISFWPHPRTVLQKDAIKLRLLTSLEEKRQLILACGVDDFHVLPFTRAFAALSAQSFAKEYLREMFGVDLLVAGFNHHLGRDARLESPGLKEAIRPFGIQMMEVPPYVAPNGDTVSSTKIRASLAQGLVETANSWLGYPYALSGVVVEGHRLGRTLGFPTANIKLYEPLKQLPANGVYDVKVWVQDVCYRGMTNIGVRPTMGNGTDRSIETHLFDFDEDIYGLTIKIEFLRHVRPEIAFPSLGALKEQLAIDKQTLQLFHKT